MKDIDDKTIMESIGRFLAGETSCGEEQAIYDYFSSGRPVSAEAEPYREMFGWYAGLAGREEAAGEKKTAPVVRLLKLRSWQWASVAAVVAVLLCVGFVHRSPFGQVPEEYMAYEGSYIIRDGKKITDLSVVVPEIERAERLVNERLSQLDLSIEEADRAFDRALEADYDMSNPTVAEAIEATMRY